MRDSSISGSPISSGAQKVKPSGRKVSKVNSSKQPQSSKFLRQNPTLTQERGVRHGKHGANGDKPTRQQGPAIKSNNLIPRINLFGPRNLRRLNYAPIPSNESKIKPPHNSGSLEPIKTLNIRTKSISPIKQNTDFCTEPRDSSRQEWCRRSVQPNHPTPRNLQSPDSTYKNWSRETQQQLHLACGRHAGSKPRDKGSQI